MVLFKKKIALLLKSEIMFLHLIFGKSGRTALKQASEVRGKRKKNKEMRGKSVTVL